MSELQAFRTQMPILLARLASKSSVCMRPLCTDPVADALKTGGANRGIAEHPLEQVWIVVLQALDLVRHLRGQFELHGNGTARGPVDDSGNHKQTRMKGTGGGF
jgi:hypothetical protein